MEKNACCESDTCTLKTVERQMSSKLCLLESGLGKTSCEVEEIVSKVMAGSNVTMFKPNVMKIRYEVQNVLVSWVLHEYTHKTHSQT